MNTYVLRLVKGSRHEGTCGRCHQRVTWAVCAPRGKSVPLIERPIILRDEQNARGVAFEVVGGDQVHVCPVQTVASRATMTPRRRRGPKQPVFGGFSTDRMQQLRDAVEHGTKPPDSPQGDLF